MIAAAKSNKIRRGKKANGEVFFGRKLGFDFATYICLQAIDKSIAYTYYHLAPAVVFFKYLGMTYFKTSNVFLFNSTSRWSSGLWREMQESVCLAADPIQIHVLKLPPYI